MRVSLKTVVITGEVTVLAAFTGVGLHLFLQPHRFAQAPPPITLPRTRAGAFPGLTTAAPAPSLAATAVATPADLTPGWMAQFNRDDRTQLQTEWDILQRLTHTVERFLEQRVVPAMEGRR